MKYAKRFLSGIFMILPLVVLLAGCGGGGGGGSPAPAPALVSITVTPANPSAAAGTTVQFTALGTYSNNITIDVTTAATWSSSSGTVATVSDAAGSKGLATAVTAGTTEIVASVGIVSNRSTLTVTSGAAASVNVMPITVNGSLCSEATSFNYLNKPCVSVTVCNPGSSTCLTINDILLDTGSFGLRVYKGALTGLTLPQVASGPGSLAECIQFADNTSVWGPVQLASVKLGNEPAVQIPIHVIDASFGTRPINCANADPDPVTAGFTGILGVGLFAEDCGLGCVNNPNIGIYYRCTDESCVGTTVELADQVQNPAARLPQDNNGLLVQLPAVPLGGVPSITGSLIFGINTRTNNIPASPTVFPTDQFGDFRTVFSGVNSVSFLDTGSNGLFFPSVSPLLPICAPPNNDWYCPPVTRELLRATTVGAFGTPSASIPFNISNFLSLESSPNNVFSDIGGPSTFGFDWGLPFFMGRSVFFGYDDRVSVLGTGPFYAY